MGCNCNKNLQRLAVIKNYAVVDNVTMANTPNLIPPEDKYNNIVEAKAAAEASGRYVVAIIDR